MTVGNTTEQQKGNSPSQNEPHSTSGPADRERLGDQENDSTNPQRPESGKRKGHHNDKQQQLRQADLKDTHASHSSGHGMPQFMGHNAEDDDQMKSSEIQQGLP